MFPGGKTSPEEFGLWIVEQVVGKLDPRIKQMLKEAPTKLYDILRQTPQGPVQQQVSLPQMLAELTDAMRVQSYFSSEGLKLSAEQLKLDVELLKEVKLLTAELKRSRKLAKSMALEADDEDA